MWLSGRSSRSQSRSSDGSVGARHSWEHVDRAQPIVASKTKGVDRTLDLLQHVGAIRGLLVVETEAELVATDMVVPLDRTRGLLAIRTIALTGLVASILVAQSLPLEIGVEDMVEDRGAVSTNRLRVVGRDDVEAVALGDGPSARHPSEVVRSMLREGIE